MVGALFRSHQRIRLRPGAHEGAGGPRAARLAEKADQAAENLNAPERKRLEIAKALAREPELLLLEEVMAGLNAAEVALAVGVIYCIREQGVSILMIEHVMQAITSLADRVVVLHHGEKILEGPPADVLSDELVIGAYLGARRARSDNR
jgi:branched-chain amino acid transport system ATP-binding protein